MLYDNLNVGENIQDHNLLSLSFEAAPGESTLVSLRNETRFANALAEYTTNHNGPLAAGSCNAYVSFSQMLAALSNGQSHLPPPPSQKRAFCCTDLRKRLN